MKASTGNTSTGNTSTGLKKDAPQDDAPAPEWKASADAELVKGFIPKVLADLAAKSGLADLTAEEVVFDQIKEKEDGSKIYKYKTMLKGENPKLMILKAQGEDVTITD